MAQAAVDAIKSSVTIALRYAASRPQVGGQPCRRAPVAAALSGVRMRGAAQLQPVRRVLPLTLSTAEAISQWRRAARLPPPLPLPRSPQFNDRPILEYITHQRRLLPALGTAYALHLALQTVKVGRAGGRAGRAGGRRGPRGHVNPWAPWRLEYKQAVLQPGA